MGTDGGGLVQLRQEHLRVLGEAEGLPSAPATGIAQTSSNQIVVSYLSEGAFTGDGQHFSPFGPLELIHAQHFVRALCVANNGDAWFGSASEGLLCLHHDRVVTFDAASALAGTTLTYLHASPNGHVWAGTLSGQIYRCGESDPKLVGSVDGAVTAMLSTLPDQLFIGTAAGSVWRLRGEDLAPLVAKPPPPASPITCLCEDSSGRVWVGSQTNGLHCLFHRTVTSWGATQDLAGLRIYGLITDLDDNLWLTTSAGLALAEKSDLNEALRSRIFPAPRIIEHLNVAETETGGGNSVARAKDGSLWFILQGQVIHVNPRLWRPLKTPPAVYIESVRVNDVELKRFAVETTPGSLSEKSEIHLPAHVRGLDVQFTTPCLTSPDRTRFRYRLEGVDADWIEGNPLDRRAHYGVIPFGRYRFCVIAAGSDGIWNQEGVAFPFVVPIPLWRQRWILGLGVLALAGAAAWLVRNLSHRRLRSRLSDLERSEELSRERMRIAQDMHDEIGSKLARISFLSEVVKTETKGFYRSAEVLDSLAKTSRDLLHSLDRMVWAVNPRNDSLENLASYLNRYASEYFQSTPIACQLVIPTSLPSTPLSSEIRHNIFLAFEETLTNTIKHSAASRVSVDLTVEHERLRISISDDGAGFELASPPAAPPGRPGGNRLGLSNLRHRMQSIGGECEIRSRPGQGTIVTLSLQLPHSYGRHTD